ncbi:MAG: protein kinase, partial [Gemmatimonadota bacterium]
MRDTVALLTSALAGRYTVERELGRGGMATVYLAHDIKHNRHVAIKVLRPELAASIGPERFLREIQIAAGLHHPHILSLYDSGQVGMSASRPGEDSSESAARPSGQPADILYYVMPYVEGESLRDRIRREKQLPLADALAITREVGTALAYAHGRGVVHRDIKPENIMLDVGQAVVTDFGIARAVAAAGGENLTETGMSLGTAAYMSPEQATASEIDGRSDTYSLGCVLYEMLAGEPPYTGPNAQAILARRFTEPVPSLRAVRDIPPSVEDAITRALARAPADRFPTVAAFVEALAPSAASGATGTSTAIHAPPAPARKPRWLAYGLGLGVLALLVAVFGLGRMKGSGTRAAAVTTPVLVVLPFENLGAAEDQYFADGITEELTARLAGLQGLRVIGRTSAIQYKNTTKSIAQIGEELGANYILEGTVRWEKPATGPSRVRVTPQLIRVGDQSHVWAGTFDAVLADVFQVQTDIATQVTQKLNVTLLEPEQAILAARPTQNTEAYDYYLRGVSYGSREYSRDDLLQAVAMYRKATDIDSTFVSAWAAKARAHLYLSWLHAQTDAVAEAETALDRATALAPNSPDVRFTSGYYYYYAKRDYQRALEEFRQVRADKPNDAEVVAAIAFIERRLSRWDDAVRDLESAIALDPRNLSNIGTMGETFCLMRRYPEADKNLSQAIAMAPDVSAYHRLLALCRILAGDTASAAQAVRDAVTLVPAGLAFTGTPTVTPTLLPRVLGRSLPETIRKASLASFGGDSLNYYLLRMAYLDAVGETGQVRAVADSTRRMLEGRIRVRSENRKQAEQVPLETSLALPEVFLGRNDDAVRHIHEALERVPVSSDGLAGPLVRAFAVEVLIRAHRLDEALDLLEQALKTPGT